MPGQQLARLSITDCYANDPVACCIDHAPDKPLQLSVSIAVIAGLSGALWGIVWYVGHGIMGL